MSSHVVADKLAESTAFHQFVKVFKFICLQAGPNAIYDILMSPFTRVQVIEQTANVFGKDSPFLYKKSEFLSTTNKIYVAEGWGGLYNKNGAYFLKSIVSSTLNIPKRLIYKYFKRRIPQKSFLAWRHSSLGIITDAFFLVFTYPFDLILTRMDASLPNRVEHEAYRQGFFKALQSVIQTNGVLGLYHGITFALISKFPYIWLKVGLIKLLQFLVPKDHPLYHTLRSMIPIATKFLIYPLDTMQKRLQVANMPLSTKDYRNNPLVVARTLYKEEGITHGLYSGVSMNLIKMYPGKSVLFLVQETMRQTIAQ